jgi:hypothetical protein
MRCSTEQAFPEKLDVLSIAASVSFEGMCVLKSYKGNAHGWI